MERFLLEHDASNFIAAVDKAKSYPGPVLLTLRAFYHEPEVLYVALDYASSLDVAVQVAPQSDQ